MADNPDNFYRRTRTARKIIVVDLGFLGDSVHLVPALWELKRNYPSAELHTLSAPVGAEVLKLAPCVDRAWVFPLSDPSPPWWQHWDVIRALRRERFDLALNLGGADRTVFLTALTGARSRAAYLGARDHFWKRWLIPVWVPRTGSDLQVFEQRRQILKTLGLDLGPARFDLKIPAEAVRWAAEKIPTGAVHLSINASTHLKEWPLENWLGLTRGLLQNNLAPLLVATTSAKPREQERLAALSRQIADPRLLAIRQPLDIPRLAALLGRCALHIGADSGVLHLAMAAGTGTLAIFREYGGLQEWLPTGPRHRHLTAPCTCALAGQASPQCATHAVCLAGISSEAVLRVAGEMLREVPA